MALTPTSSAHELQIEAGTIGRKKGHKFESTLSEAINRLEKKTFCPNNDNDSKHIFAGGRTGLFEYYDGELVKYYNKDNSILALSSRLIIIGCIALLARSHISILPRIGQTERRHDLLTGQRIVTPAQDACNQPAGCGILGPERGRARQSRLFRPFPFTAAAVGGIFLFVHAVCPPFF